MTASATPVACYGDSLTAGSGASDYADYPAVLSELLGGREVINRGVGGQHAPEIVCRTGTAAPLLVLSGDTLPASGPVGVTAVSVDFLRLPKDGDIQVSGHLAGVPGVVSATTAIVEGVKSVAYSFERTKAVASDVRVPPCTPFLVDASDEKRACIPVIWAGRNDLSRARNKADTEASDQVDLILSYVSRAVDHLQANGLPFVVMSVPGYDDADEYTGTDVYDERMRLNNYLAERYADNFVDVSGLLMLSGDGSAQDQADIANGITPTSLRSDLVHLNDAGYSVVAKAVAALFVRKGW